MPQDLPITAMFEELVAGGFITPTHHMEDMEFPGSLRRAPSVIGYATPDIPIRESDPRLRPHQGQLYENIVQLRILKSEKCYGSTAVSKTASGGSTPPSFANSDQRRGPGQAPRSRKARHAAAGNEFGLGVTDRPKLRDGRVGREFAPTFSGAV